MYIWKKRKLAQSYLPDYIPQPITISYIFELSILVHHCEIEHDHEWKYILVSFRSTAFYSNLVHILQRHFGPCHFLIWFLNWANVIEFFILFGRSFHIFAPLYRYPCTANCYTYNSVWPYYTCYIVIHNVHIAQTNTFKLWVSDGCLQA